ncbi:MAG: prenyltransferase/squalene oxidase repeat-containing protein [Bythopirellula sp.]|nr:prenyltransferase/squalene oxidase repeat-containing protein [Bythopirellula sp.]
MIRLLLICGFLTAWVGDSSAQQRDSRWARENVEADVLSADEWEEVDEAVDVGLDWLARQQQPDGSFPTMPHAQPGVTSLCVLAFLSHGHLPGEGQHGEALEKAIDYIAGCQKRNGLLALVAPNGDYLSRNIDHDIGYTVVYNHAIGALVLCETYAMDGAKRAQELEPVIKRALDATLEMQNWPKDHAVDEGGWRYLDDHDDRDSDLSVTGWQLMFLRSAKNAGFDVADDPIRRAIVYVRRCFRRDVGSFSYKTGHENRVTRGMSGAGVLALAHAGLHGTPEAKLAGDWVLRSGFDEYNGYGRVNGSRREDDRYHYGLLTCCQAMYQLGGTPWHEFYPPTVNALLSGQSSEGSWLQENHHVDRDFGTAYTSAICLLALGAPNQLLPVFQR